MFLYTRKLRLLICFLGAVIALAQVASAMLLSGLPSLYSSFIHPAGRILRPAS